MDIVKLIIQKGAADFNEAIEAAERGGHMDIERKYPLLIEFKWKNQTWKEFYLEMVYYLSKLEEKFGIPYIPTKDYNPKKFYKKYKDSKNIY